MWAGAIFLITSPSDSKSITMPWANRRTQKLYHLSQKHLLKAINRKIITVSFTGSELVCVKIWNGMNLASMQIFRSVILITGYVTLKPRQLNFNDTFPLTYSSSSQFTLYCVSQPRVSNCLVNKSRLACVISIYLASALVVKGRLLLTNSMLKLALKNPLFHLPKNFITGLAYGNPSRKMGRFPFSFF